MEKSELEQTGEVFEVEVLRENNITKTRENVKSGILEHFSKDEILELLKQLPPNKYGILFQLLWRTGVRVSEAIGIRKKDLDFDNSTIQIRWLKSRKYKYRLIPMHNTLRAVLWSYTGPMNAEQRLFPFTRQYVDQLCKKHGFGHAHKIRHSFAINFLRQSDKPMALVELKELLGHSQIRTTLEYLKVVPQNLQKSLESISFD